MVDQTRLSEKRHEPVQAEAVPGSNRVKALHPSQESINMFVR